MEGIHKIMTHLWFDKEAAEAGEFYLKVFENSKLLSRGTIPGTPSGDVESLTIEIEDISLMLLSAGPYFKVNPSISFMVTCSSKDEVMKYWEAFIDGGQALMPIDNYDFSELYGWVEDKFGISWQIMYSKDEQINAKIRPALMFVGENCGRADEAIEYYTKVFKNSEIKAISRYGENFPPNKPEMINFAEFILEAASPSWIALMNMNLVSMKPYRLSLIVILRKKSIIIGKNYPLILSQSNAGGLRINTVYHGK